MILSTSHNFIFVHIPKTAGLAMTDALKDFKRSYERSLLRSISRRLPFQEHPERAHFREHEKSTVFIRKLGRDVFDSFSTFSVVRNPFDHAVSHFEYMKQFRIASTASKVGAMGFEEYLRYRMKPPFWNDTTFARMRDQSSYLVDETGKIAVDRLLRFENLSDEVDALAQDLNLEGVVLRRVNKTKSKSDKRPFQSYYDETTLELVRQIYARDFDLIGYARDLPEVR